MKIPKLTTYPKARPYIEFLYREMIEGRVLLVRSKADQNEDDILQNLADDVQAVEDNYNAVTEE